MLGRVRVVIDEGGSAPHESGLALAIALKVLEPRVHITFAGPARVGRASVIDQHVRWLSSAHLFACTRARIVATTHGLPRVFLKTSISVQLFHGVPLKRMGLEHRRYGSSGFDGVTPRQSAWSFVVTPTEFTDRHLVEAGRVDGLRVRVSPPRYELLRDRIEQDSDEDRNPERMSVMYAPTYRAPADGSGVDPVAIGRALSSRLRGTGVDLRFLPHPVDRQRGGLPNLGAALDHLGQVDVVVSDYSSLLFDASVFAVPTLIFAPDLRDYERSPGLTIPIMEASTLGVFASVDEVAEVLTGSARPRFDDGVAMRRRAVVEGREFSGATDLATRLLAGA